MGIIQWGFIQGILSGDFNRDFKWGFKMGILNVAVK